jgi:hypothetical protein
MNKTVTVHLLCDDVLCHHHGNVVYRKEYKVIHGNIESIDCSKRGILTLRGPITSVYLNQSPIVAVYAQGQWSRYTVIET